MSAVLQKQTDAQFVLYPRPQIAPEPYYSYADYKNWPEQPRYELIRGERFMMPAPSRLHQKISMELSIEFGLFLRGKPQEVYAAPFDVRLNFDTADDTVVQPDLVVICDTGKLNDRHCLGAPDMVIEILSPATGKLDKTTKLQLYMEYGVREYWLIDPHYREVSVYLINGTDYAAKVYSESEKVPVSVLEGLEIDMVRVFETAGEG